jgi:AP-1 complex subunit mu
MVLSAVFITDLQGKLIISRNYRGDVPITRSIERFAKYIHDTPEEQKKPIFQSDTNSEFYVEDDVGCTGNDGETYVYINVSRFQ